MTSPTITARNLETFDFDQIEITKMKRTDKMPLKKVNTARILGKFNFLPETFTGYPSVVNIKIFVFAKIETRNEAVAITAHTKIDFIILLSSFLSNIEIMTDKVNPQSIETINMFCAASLLR